MELVLRQSLAAEDSKPVVVDMGLVVDLLEALSRV